MDLEAAWQEHRRFVLTVAAGLLVFLVGMVLVDRWFGADLRTGRSSLRRARTALAQPLHGSADLAEAQRENDELTLAVARLAHAVEFEPRERFRLDAEGAAAGNRYFAVVADVRDELVQLAGRADLSIPPELGLPPLAPTRDPEIRRHLEALDVVDRTVRMAADVGVRRVDEIRIALDPALLAGKSPGRVERTRIEMTLSGESGPLVELMALTQQPRDGRAILVEEVELTASGSRRDEARLDLVLLVAHLHGLDHEALVRSLEGEDS